MKKTISYITVLLIGYLATLFVPTVISEYRLTAFSFILFFGLFGLIYGIYKPKSCWKYCLLLCLPSTVVLVIESSSVLSTLLQLGFMLVCTFLGGLLGKRISPKHRPNVFKEFSVQILNND